MAKRTHEPRQSTTNRIRAASDAVFLGALSSPWIRAHSGTSRFYGPPRGRTTIEQLSRRGLRFHRAFKAYAPDWSSITYSDGTGVDFEVPLPSRFPEVGTLDVPDGRILSEHGWPVTARDELITDSCFIHEHPRFRYFEFDTRRRPVEHLPGRVLNLTSAWCAKNFGHALLDALGRLAIVLEAGARLQDFDHVVVPDFESHELEFVLDQVGVPRSARRRARADTHIRADLLTVTSFPGTPRCYPSWLAPFFRGLLPGAGAGAASGGGRRLWISRPSGVRALSNSREATDVARSLGYRSHTPVRGANDLLAIGAAETVAGPHGAAMAALVAAPRGSRFIELLPTGHRYPYFATLAASSGLQYTAVRCSSLTEARNADCVVDLKELADALRTG